MVSILYYFVVPLFPFLSTIYLACKLPFLAMAIVLLCFFSIFFPCFPRVFSLPWCLPGDGRDGSTGNQSDSPLAKLAPKVQQEEVDEDKASRIVVHVDM